MEDINKPLDAFSQEDCDSATHAAMLNGFITAFSEDSAAEKTKIEAALTVLNDSIHDVTHRGARAFLICEKLSNKWVWKWCNLDSDPTELIAAMRPIYEGAMAAMEKLTKKDGD